MPPDLEIFRLSSALASHASARQSVIARNVAHVDTPGYTARDLPAFDDIMRKTSASPLRARQTREGHEASPDGPIRMQARAIDVDGTESPNGNSVTLEDQMVRAAETRRQHDLAMAVYRKSMEIFRLGLSRPR